VQAKFDSRKIGEGLLISCENRPLRGQGSGCDHEIMSTPGPALLPDKDKELRVGIGNIQVVVDHGNVRENVVKKLLPAHPRLASAQLDTDAKLRDSDGCHCHVIVVIDHVIERTADAFRVDEECCVQQQPRQLRSSTVMSSRTVVRSACHSESTPCRRSIVFTSEPRPLRMGSSEATALPLRTMVIRSPRCSTASRRSAKLRAASVALISVTRSDYQINVKSTLGSAT
jgi:hypothetical protein